MLALPVPSPCRKSPPWIMKSLICVPAYGQLAEQFCSFVGWEGTDDAVEFAPFVALRSALCVLRLARAELPEVFGRLGRRVGEKLHFDAAERFACERGDTC